MNFDDLREIFSPWIDIVISHFSKNCQIDYEIEILEFLHKNIDHEIKDMFKDRNRRYVVARTHALHTALTYLYNHFSLKLNHQKNSPNVEKSSVKLLSEIIQTCLILSGGLPNSEWIDRVLTTIRLFKGNPVLVYDAVLLINVVKPLYHNAYREILKHVLTNEDQEHITEPLVYMVVILLFRRLKVLFKNKQSKTFVNSMAARLKPPSNLISWMSKENLDVNKLKYKTMSKQLMKHDISELIIKTVQSKVLNCYSFNSDRNKNRFQKAVSEPSNKFFIDSSSVAGAMDPSSRRSTSKKCNSSLSEKKKKQSVLKQKHCKCDGTKTTKSTSDETKSSVYYIHDYSNLVADRNHSESSNLNQDICNNSDFSVGTSATNVHSSNMNESQMHSVKMSMSKSGYKNYATSSESKSEKYEIEVINVSGSDSSVQLIPLKKSKQSKFVKNSSNVTLKNSDRERKNANFHGQDVSKISIRKRKKNKKRESLGHKMKNSDEPVADHMLALYKYSEESSSVSKITNQSSDLQMSEGLSESNEVQHAEMTLSPPSELNKDEEKYESKKRKFSTDVDSFSNIVSCSKKKMVDLVQELESCPSSTADKDNSHNLENLLVNKSQTSDKSNQYTESNNATIKFSDQNILSDKSEYCTGSANIRYFHRTDICSDMNESSQFATKTTESCSPQNILNTDGDCSGISFQDGVPKSDSLPDEENNVTSSTSKSKLINSNLQLKSIEDDSYFIDNRASNSISSESSDSECENGQNSIMCKKDPDNISLSTKDTRQETKMSLDCEKVACFGESKNVSGENIKSESESPEIRTKSTDTSLKYVDPGNKNVLCSESNPECSDIAVSNGVTSKEVLGKSFDELEICSAKGDLSDISVLDISLKKTVDADKIISVNSGKVYHLKESENVSSGENIESKSGCSEIPVDILKCMDIPKISGSMLCSKDNSKCCEVAAPKDMSTSSISSLKICNSESKLSDISISADTPLKENNETKSFCNISVDKPHEPSLESSEGDCIVQLKTQINSKLCANSEMVTDSFVEITPPMQSTDNLDCFSNTTNVTKNISIPSREFEEQHVQQLILNKSTTDEGFEIHKCEKSVENANEHVSELNSNDNCKLADISGKDTNENSSPPSPFVTPCSSTEKTKLSLDDSSVLDSELQEKSKCSLKSCASESVDVLNRDMEILQKASRAKDITDDNKNREILQTSNSERQDKNLKEAEPESFNEFSDQDCSLSKENKKAHSEHFPYICESKNYLSFSDISLTKKDTSNEESDLKSPNQIRNFAFAATTEIFSSYRNDLFPEEEKTEAGPVSKDDVSSYTHELSDDTKSQNLSSDSNYECESEPSSEEEDSQAMEKEMTQTKNSVENFSEDINYVKTDNESTAGAAKIVLAVCQEKTFADNDDISSSHASENDCLKELTLNNELIEEVTKLPRHSLRLKSKAEIKNSINLEDSKADSSSEIAVEKEWEVPEIEIVDEKLTILEKNGTVCDNPKDTISIPLVENNHIAPQSSDSIIIKSPARESRKSKSKAANSKVSGTPPKRYSLRQKSKRQTDDSSKLGIDFSQLHLDSPSRRKNPVVLMTDSPIKDVLSNLPLFTKQETCSSVAKILKEEPIPSTPSYNLRTRKPIIAPGKLVI